jgi:hypothetical protein
MKLIYLLKLWIIVNLLQLPLFVFIEELVLNGHDTLHEDLGKDAGAWIGIYVQSTFISFVISLPFLIVTSIVLLILTRKMKFSSDLFLTWLMVGCVCAVLNWGAVLEIFGGTVSEGRGWQLLPSFASTLIAVLILYIPFKKLFIPEEPEERMPAMHDFQLKKKII